MKCGTTASDEYQHPVRSALLLVFDSHNTPMGLSRFLVTILLAVAAQAAIFQPQIPSVQSFYPDELGQVFTLSPGTRIVVDETSCCASDRASGPQPDGATLLNFAETFRSDLMDMTSLWFPPVQVMPFNQTQSTDSDGSIIALRLCPSSNHTLYSGAPTSEAYDFFISNSSYVICGSGPMGVWWGTRTLLQQLALSGKGYNRSYTIAAGNGTDSPGWEVRGFMLDVGRHWYTTEFLGKGLFA